MVVITNWSRVRSIGRGATAIVSLSVNTNSGQFFAVKSTDISRSSSLQREQSILSALHSPYIISYLGFDIATDESYNLFLEYAPSGSLCDVIRSHGGRIDEPTVRAYAANILHGLAYIHSNSVVYCGIKSSYVVGSNGRAKIADFGCAQRGFCSNKTQTIMGIHGHRDGHRMDSPE
ncbi:mitogen-activated protein kinase kinase kinase 17-like [Typha latifolia]|uniref:mitogen-activated protein kinase kinase kinase 17-like n=1 Tax=Typha latifolia TaxID=4733 RepID=UPI003C30092E